MRLLLVNEGSADLHARTQRIVQLRIAGKHVLEQLVRRAGMAADLLAELDATRDELRTAHERLERQEATIADLRDERDGARAAVAQRWALRREVEGGAEREHDTDCPDRDPGQRPAR